MSFLYIILLLIIPKYQSQSSTTITYSSYSKYLQNISNILDTGSNLKIKSYLRNSTEDNLLYIEVIYDTYTAFPYIDYKIYWFLSKNNLKNAFLLSESYFFGISKSYKDLSNQTFHNIFLCKLNYQRQFKRCYDYYHSYDSDIIPKNLSILLNYEKDSKFKSDENEIDSDTNIRVYNYLLNDLIAEKIKEYSFLLKFQARLSFKHFGYNISNLNVTNNINGILGNKSNENITIFYGRILNNSDYIILDNHSFSLIDMIYQANKNHKILSEIGFFIVVVIFILDC